MKEIKFRDPIYKNHKVNSWLHGKFKKDSNREWYVNYNDKNSVEIYTGDILDWGKWKKGEGERCYVAESVKHGGFIVYYFSKYGGEGYDTWDNFIRLRLHCGKKQPFEIIGNCQENPEILE